MIILIKAIFSLILIESIAFALVRRYSLLFSIKRFNYPWESEALKIGMAVTPMVFLISWWKMKNNKKFFLEQMQEMFDHLDVGVEYETETHDIVIKRIQRMEKAGSLKIIKKIKKKSRRLITEKIALMNFKGIGRKVDSYQINFVILEKPVVQEI